VPAANSFICFTKRGMIPPKSAESSVKPYIFQQQIWFLGFILVCVNLGIAALFSGHPGMILGYPHTLFIPLGL